MSFAFAPTPDATPPSAFGAAPRTFPAFATQAPASAATSAATAAASSTASPPPSTVTFGAFAGMSFPAGPVQPNPFPAWPSASPSASGFGFPSGSGFHSSPFASTAGPAPFANNPFGPAAFPAVQPHLTPTPQLLTPKHEHEFAAQLDPHLKTRGGVFALSWHEPSPQSAEAWLPGATLLMRYLAVGEYRCHHWLTPSGLERAHGWIVEKLAAELADGHGYDHELRDLNDRSALDVLLSDWKNQPQLVLSMAQVLLAAPAVRLRDGKQQETRQLVASIAHALNLYPDRLESGLATIALILKRGGSFDEALQAIIAKARIELLLRVIKAATVEKLQSVSSATLNQARQIEQERPYWCLVRLCRELIERVCEWQAAEALVSSVGSSSSSPLAASASLPGAPSSLGGSSLSSSSLAAWLSAFESALPARMIAHQRVSHGCSEAEWLAALDWLELAEDGLMRTLLGTADVRRATVMRVQQLATRERARAADDAVSPASGPLSPPALIARVILAALAAAKTHDDPTDALLRALLSAATAPVFADSSPSSLSGGLALPGALDAISLLPEHSLMRVALLFHEAGIVADARGSFTLCLLRNARWAALPQWMAPEHARFSMPVGWLGERDTKVSASLAAIPVQPHPHLAADARCDVWDAVCRVGQVAPNAPIQQFVRHAIDWHYATVTPVLRSALSAHLLPELHAGVLSCLMPPSTLRDPAPPATEADPSLLLLESAIAALLPSQSAIAAQLRQVHQRLIDVQHQLREAQVERGFAERASDAEAQMLALREPQ